MPVSEKQKNRHYEYEKKSIKRIPLDVQKSYYDEVLKPAAEAAGEPVNTFIKKAIDDRINKS